MATVERGIHLVFARDDVLPVRHHPYRVRFHEMLEAFTIYPRNDRDLAINKLLWHAVRESSFQSRPWPSKLIPICAEDNDHGQEQTDTEKIIFALGIPEQLVNYLKNVTLAEMQESILCMLVDAARSENREGLQAMRKELAPSVWGNLELLLADGKSSATRKTRQHPPATGPATSNTRRRLAVEDTSPETHEGDDRQDHQSPQPPANLSLARLDAIQESCLYASHLLDQALHIAQDQNYWQIAITGATFEPAPAWRPVMCDSDQAVAIHGLYKDWQLRKMNREIDSSANPNPSAARGTKRPASPTSPALGTGGMAVRAGSRIEDDRKTLMNCKKVLTTAMTLAHQQPREGSRRSGLSSIPSTESCDLQTKSSSNPTTGSRVIQNTLTLHDQRCLECTEKSVSTFQTLDLIPSKVNQKTSL